MIPTYRELLQERSACVEEMRALGLDSNDKPKALSAEQEKQFNRLESLGLRLDEQIKAMRVQNDTERDLSTAGMSASVTYRTAEPTGEWRDKDGKPVTVLSRGQSLATAVRNAGEKPSEYSIGDVVKRMVGAPVRKEVRAALDESTSGGGYLINPALSAQIIDRIRAKSRVMQAGATTVQMPTSELFMARLVSDPVAVWHVESAADLQSNGPTFDRVTFLARTLGCVFLVSRELVEDSANVDAVCENALTAAFSLETDRAALLGNGSGTSPIGLASTSGVTQTTGGACTDYSQFVSSAGRVQANSQWPSAFITSPTITAKLGNLQDTLHQPLRVPPYIQDIPLLDSAKVGIGSPVNQQLFTGDFSKLMIGIRNQFELSVLRERFWESGQIGIGAWSRLDVQVAHTASFDIVNNLS